MRFSVLSILSLATLTVQANPVTRTDAQIAEFIRAREVGYSEWRNRRQFGS
jgi:hypothetical protein